VDSCNICMNKPLHSPAMHDEGTKCLGVEASNTTQECQQREGVVRSTFVRPREEMKMVHYTLLFLSEEDSS
jgi:hypothetical protein